MNYILYNSAYAKTIFQTLYKSINKDKTYVLSFDEVVNLKTKKQLGFIFGGIIKAIRLYFNNFGSAFTDTQIKEWLYDEIGIYENVYLPNGKVKTIVKSLSVMTKQEASNFIYRLLDFIDTSDIFKEFVLTPDLRYCWVNQIDEKLIAKIEQSPLKYYDEKFLKYQRSLKCIRCGRQAGEAHHIKLSSGLGRKNPDWFTIPICRECHTYLHSVVGEENFLNEICSIFGNLDIKLFCKAAYYNWNNHKF